MSALRKHALLLSTAFLFAVFAILLSFLPGAGARADQRAPSLKICNVLAAGTTARTGVTFSFKVAGLGTFTAAPGACVEIPGAPPGRVTVSENVPPGFQVAAIRFTAGSGTTDIAAGTATARVVAGRTVVLEFTNSAPTGSLRFCTKLPAGPAAASSGGPFRFSVDGQSIAVAPGACATVTDLPVGFVSIRQLPAPDFQVIAIRYISGTGTTNVANGSTTADILAGRTTEVEFASAATGWIQICKETSGVTGTFSFTSPNFAGTQAITIITDGESPVCGPLVQVPAGTITVTEAAGPDFILAGVRTGGAAEPLSLSGRTATVTVRPGGPAQVTQIIFRNAATGMSHAGAE